ncbi:MDR family MFS transporter [Furfurilactobacillus siliginis]|uniref:MFS transporter n=1 Tax=Furfurilactobacillus siliginis TaxID=348151 RepID=A0A0R2L6P3_9LACO|nr:MFS transporter [Furfurilactobacillus siliginis]KRN97347.1 major facilitator superfamily permease [Furfurilactobacillus siliginis]GEK28979.1 MFS transporter [Furfurilactobacillus siliginis]
MRQENTGKEIKLPWLLAAGLLNNMGQSFIWPLTTIYIHDALHESLTVVGLVLLLNSAASIVGAYLGGWLFDRVNAYKLTLIATLFELTATVFLIFWHGWPAFPIGLVFMGFGSGLLITVINSLGTTIKSHDGRYVFNMIYFMQNLGVVFGTMMVGFVYQHGVQYLFIITAAMYIGYFFIALTQFNVPAVTEHATHSKHETINRKLPRPNRIVIWTFFIALIVIWIMYEQWVSNMAVYMTDQGIPLTKYSFLWTVNAGLILVFQLGVNFLGERIRNPYYQIIPGILAVAFSFVILLFVKQYAGFVLAMAVLTLGEATAFPAIPALVNQLTPLDMKGKYQGSVNAAASAGRALGPLLGGILIDATSYKFMFGFAAVAVVVTWVMVIVIRRWQYHKTTHY